LRTKDNLQNIVHDGRNLWGADSDWMRHNDVPQTIYCTDPVTHASLHAKRKTVE